VVHLPEAMPELPQSDSWYREVLELRKKAGEYKVSHLLLATYQVIRLFFLSHDSISVNIVVNSHLIKCLLP
jgi:hypothetical protein